MNKNDTFEIYIDDLGQDGEGIGHIDGEAVFVKDALPGDTAIVKIIKAKKKYAYGRLMEVLSPSVYRTEAKCANARACGGCTLMHMDYQSQLKFKRDRIINCMTRIGGQDKELIEKMLGEVQGVKEPFRFRNKMQFPIGKDKDGNPVIGFYAGRTHHIIPEEDCITGHPVNKHIVKAVKDYIVKFNVSTYDEETLQGLMRHVITRIGFATGEVMVCFVINGESLPHSNELVEMLKSAINVMAGDETNAGELTLSSVMISINRENTNRILGTKSKCIYGKPYIDDYIEDIRFSISAESFYQVNPEMTVQLYSKAREFAELSGNETVWDMYCGIGTISLFISKMAKKVYGVEIVPEAIENARNNAAQNGIENAEFFVGKAEEVVPDIYAGKLPGSRADVVIVDPPRKGCDEKLLETICLMNPEKLVYVSCDPATLARDVKYLTERGFMLKKMAGFDQFCHTGHVESCVLLERVSNRKADSYVKLNVKMEDYYRIKDAEGGEADG